MEIEFLAIIFGILLFAAFVKGGTGLGFSTTAMPLLALTIGLKTALPLLIIPALASNALVMADAGNFRATARQFWPLYILVLPGVGLGLAILTQVRSSSAGAVLGAVLLVYGFLDLKNPHTALPPKLVRPVAPLVGFLTGTISGLTGSQVMPVLPYLMSLRLEPNHFVQAVNISFTITGLAMMLGLSTIGMLTFEAIAISIIGLVPVFVGVKVGNKLRHRLSPLVFRRTIMLLLMISGLLLVVKAWG